MNFPFTIMASLEHTASHSSILRKKEPEGGRAGEAHNSRIKTRILKDYVLVLLVFRTQVNKVYGNRDILCR